MTLFVSDLHLGETDDPAVERRHEARAVDLLRAHYDRCERLYLVGDVFEAYIEYRHLVPKGFVRLQAELARWTDGGRRVTYLTGNHDPWHAGYFEKELGVRVLTRPTIERIEGCAVYLAHGDAVDGSRRAQIKEVLEHPLPVAAYRTLLPADAGLGLARWVARRFGNEGVDPTKVEALRRHARRVLAETLAEVVVMAHTHRAAFERWDGLGTYVNPGYFREEGTFATMEEGGTLRVEG